MDWNQAYQNTGTIKDKYNWNVAVCKTCMVVTEGGETTIRQQLGNAVEIITKCLCGKYFVRTHKFV